MKNYAFISYSHKDIRTVRKLHKRIENFAIPRMVRRLVKNAPRRLFPIFRDETDLSGVTLTPKIEEALEASDFLIVVCTKNSADSVWVKREITAFLKTHTPEQIIPVFLDKQTQRDFEDGFPNMLAALDMARDNRVLYAGFRKKPALVEIASRLLRCYSPTLIHQYTDPWSTRRLAALFFGFVVALIFYTDISWLYKDHFDTQEYCRDISFSYGEPKAVEPLNCIARLFAEDYYICTYRSNHIVRIQRVSRDEEENTLPGSFLLESEIMEFDYTLWQREGRVSKVVFRDSNDQVLLVKNVSLNIEIADLTVAPDSCAPYYLPADMASPQGSSIYSCRIAQLYDEAGRIETIWFLTDNQSYHSCDSNGYYGITYVYGDSGEPEAVHFLDLEGNILKTHSLDSSVE